MKKPKLFETNSPTITGSKRGDISHFEYLSRSNRGEIKRYTNWWNGVFEECGLSSARKFDISSRIRSKSDNNHKGALFELFCYKFFRSLGYKIVSGRKFKNRNPDFFVSDGGKTKFHLEATCLMSEMFHEPNRTQINLITDAINAVQSDLFKLAIRYTGQITSNPSPKRIRNAVKKWLDTLDHEQLLREYKSNKDILSIGEVRVGISGLCVFLKPLPIGSSAFPKGGNIIAFGPGGPAQLLNTDKGIRNKVKKKASQCKSARLPVIIALNLLEISADLEDIYDALFGKMTFQISHRKGEIIGTESLRHHKGALRYGNEIVNSSITGLLIFSGIDIVPIPRKQPLLLLNPFRRHSFFQLNLPNVLTIDPLVKSSSLDEYERKLKENWLKLKSNWLFDTA